MSPQSSMQSIALCQLRPSRLNVRNIPPPPDAYENLKQSIRTGGIIQNLIVTPLRADDVKAAGKPRTSRKSKANRKSSAKANGAVLPVPEHLATEPLYEVCAGSQRHTAMLELAREGAIPADYQVPCQIHDANDVELIALSLQENTIRAGMDPLDQAIAFADMVECGETIDDISARFALSKTTVRQRLAITKVHPDIRAAYISGEISFSHLKAYATTSDTDRQLKVYNEHRPNYPRQIQNLLAEHQFFEDNKLAKWVGMKAYANAGGTLEEDLFSLPRANSYHWPNLTDELDVNAPEGNPRRLADPDLLLSLAHQKLSRSAKRTCKGYLWTETSLEEIHPYQVHDKFTVLPLQYRPQDETALKEAQEAMTAASKKIDEHHAEHGNDKDNPQTKVLQTARDTACETLQKARETRMNNRFHTDAQKAISGAIVTFDRQSNRVIRYVGLVRPQDAARVSELPVGEKPADTGSSKPSYRSVNRRHAGPYSLKHTDQLKEHRSEIIRTAMPANPDACFDAVAYQLCAAAMSTCYTHATEAAFNINLQSSGRDMTEMLPEEDRKRLLGWTKPSKSAKRFELFCDLSDSDKKTLVAAAAACALPPNLSISNTTAFLERTVERMDIPFEASFRPDRENYWNHISKDRCLQIASETLGDNWVAEHGRLRKGDLADKLEEAFALDENTPEAVRNWTVPEFRPGNPA